MILPPLLSLFHKVNPTEGTYKCCFVNLMALLSLFLSYIFIKNEFSGKSRVDNIFILLYNSSCSVMGINIIYSKRLDTSGTAFFRGAGRYF